MYCKKCGSLISENSKFCEYCGSKVETTEDNNSNYDDQFFDSRTERNGHTYVNNYNTNHPEVSPVSSSTGILGVLALVFTFILPFFGFVLALIGISTYKSSNNKIGYNLCKAALIIQLLFVVFFVLLFAFVFIYATRAGY